MAGPYTGTWLQSVISEAEYTGAAKWGTGINPVHGISWEGPAIRSAGTKVNIDPITTPGGQDTGAIDHDLYEYPWDSTWNPDPTLPDYDQVDSPDEVWGYGTQSGTSNRPSWGEATMGDIDSPQPEGMNPTTPGRMLVSARSKTQNSTDSNYPSWGGSRKTQPVGNRIRAIFRGDLEQNKMKVLPNEDVAQGWTNKNKDGLIADAVPADDSQVFMQTSMTQRYKVREGSQRSASQSEYDSPVESRVIGQKVKTWTRPDSARHWDMLPYEQEDYMRPFLSRQAATGYREWNYPNEMYVSPAIQREPPADPELGPLTNNYGYSYEDSGVYY